MSSLEVIHLPQNSNNVLWRASGIFLEVLLVPAALIAILGGAGQVTLGIIAVFAWRILAAVFRWGLVGLLPATSILTFALLTARTGTSMASDTVGLGTTLQMYLLPACIISFFTGVYFIVSSFALNPITLKLANDFVSLGEAARIRLLNVFKTMAFIIGILYIFSSILGSFVVFNSGEREAALFTSFLAVGTPMLTFLCCVVAVLLMLRRLQVKISFKAALQEV